MQYPLYVRRDHTDTLHASFPDFPGADVTGASLAELERNALEAVERMYDRSEQVIPAPTADTSELRTLEMDDGEGIWVFVDINLARVTSKSVNLQFSLLESLLRRVDAAAKDRHMTRSAFMTLAAVHELAKR
ncbi:type II toxin-antitoxin system HicB family antitoxin [Paraburkholderia sp. IMGN_8]|uniref:type II toxin-antitoxin system HicB family antitoxin n=1 Tax=Paraburkholderia sp. IMGN_8 TaxID=3136564 RepID=UPI003100F85F